MRVFVVIFTIVFVVVAVVVRFIILFLISSAFLFSIFVRTILHKCDVRRWIVVAVCVCCCVYVCILYIYEFSIIFIISKITLLGCCFAANFFHCSALCVFVVQLM